MENYILKNFNSIIRGLALIPQIERRYEKETSQSKNNHENKITLKIKFSLLSTLKSYNTKD